MNNIYVDIYVSTHTYTRTQREGGWQRAAWHKKKPTSELCVILGSFIFLFMLLYILQVPKPPAGSAGLAQKTPGKRCLKVTNAAVCDVVLDTEMLARKGLCVSRPRSRSLAPRLLRGKGGQREQGGACACLCSTIAQQVEGIEAVPRQGEL